MFLYKYGQLYREIQLVFFYCRETRWFLTQLTTPRINRFLCSIFAIPRSSFDIKSNIANNTWRTNTKKNKKKLLLAVALLIVFAVLDLLLCSITFCWCATTRTT